MVNARRQLERLEDRQRAGAARQIRDALALATDEQMARMAYHKERGEWDAAAAVWEEIGVSEQLVALAIDLEADEKTRDRRLRWIVADVLSDPRRTRIRRELERLRGEA